MAYSGKYIPTNPKKYRGNPSKVIYRSLWERKLMVYCDQNDKILEWGSEEIIIPYISPWDNKMHRYFPDFYVEQINTNDNIDKILIEVKPKYQTIPPVVQTTKTKKPTKRYINEVKTWGVNQAKWIAAQEFCKDRGWKFQIMHEDHLGIK